MWYFITIEAAREAAPIHDPALRTRIEQQWAAMPPPLAGSDFALNTRSLHALLQCPGHPTAAPEPPAALLLALEAFIAQQPPGFWNPQPRIRPLRNAQERRDIRDFIIQKMLGGEELGPR